ncbi:MAG TPA: zinc ribbon domain-containing protein [Thermoanaerobaculia bacterium]|nr:zinc ribbon domain-containing protein [Thermoanaerobaculia bacterium]
MPLYEYQCEACGKRTEELQRLSDPPLTVCPACGGVYKKLLSAPAFQFKGSGWYVTDYAKKGGGDAGAPDGAKTEAKTEAKQDSAGGASATEAKPPAAPAASGS